MCRSNLESLQTQSFDEQLDAAAEELIAGDSDDPRQRLCSIVRDAVCAARAGGMRGTSWRWSHPMARLGPTSR